MTLSKNDRARILLQRVAEEDNAFSRINVIGELVPHGRVNELERRAWLEVWQILERAGLICPTLDNPRGGDWWFVTSAAQAALSGDFDGELASRLPRG